MSNNLLIKIKEDQRKCLDFGKLVTSDEFQPARRIIESIPQKFISKDKNFRKQFQTTEFNQRLWELLLYKVLIDNNFSVLDSCHEYPDFELDKKGTKIIIEASSTNATENDSISELLIKGLKVI